MKSSKQPDAIAQAKAFIAAKQAELAELKAVQLRVEESLRFGHVTLRQAQEAADAALPQCRMVTVAYLGNRGNEETDRGRAVILRQTPAGSLVVRHVGDDEGTLTYKRDKLTGWFILDRSIFRFQGYYSARPELRDVPELYLSGPIAKKEASHA